MSKGVWWSKEDAAAVLRIAAALAGNFKKMERLQHLVHIIETDPDALRCRDPGCPKCKEALA